MTASSTGFDLRIYWDIMWRRKWVFVGAFFLCTVIGLALALNAKPQYQVNSTLLLRELDLQFNTGKNAMGPRVSATDDLDLLKTRILSPMVLHELIDKVGLLNDSAVTATAKEIRSSFPKLALEEIKRSLLIKKLQQKILSIRIHGDNMIQIGAQHEDPELAYNLVRTLIDIFIDQTQQMEMSGLQTGLKYSSEQLQIYKKRLEDAEARLQNLKAGSVLNKLDNQQLDDLRAENLRTISLAATNQLELEQRILRDTADDLSGSEPSPSSHSSPQINKLLNQQLAKLNLLGDLLNTNSVNEEQIFQVNKEIKDLDDALQIEVQAIASQSIAEARRSAWVESKMASLRIRFLEKKKQTIDRVLANYEQSRKASLTSAPLQQMTEDRLKDEVEQARQMYQLFLKQKEGAEMERALKNAQSPFLYRLIDPPQRPLSSIAMSKRARLMVSCVVGLGLGILLVVGLEQLDPSLRTIEAVESHLNSPVFGLMPKLEGEDFRFVLDSKEAVDVQRIASKLTKQLFRGNKSDRAGATLRPKMIMITSSVMGEGKSTFSAYLAACFAEMLKSSSVLLVDGDLRRGMQHKIFKVDNSYGLGNLLEENDNQPAASCLNQTEYAKLHLLTSGYSTESPVSLFTSEKFGKMMDQLKKYYELIIFDTPPVIPVNDALIISRYADTILYVVKAGETPRVVAARGMGLVRTTECHLSGVVMNNMQDVLPYYYRHYYYKYQYEHQEHPTSINNNGTNGADLNKHVSDDGENGAEKDNSKSSVNLIEGLQHAE